MGVDGTRGRLGEREEGKYGNKENYGHTEIKGTIAIWKWSKQKKDGNGWNKELMKITRRLWKL